MSNNAFTICLLKDSDSECVAVLPRKAAAVVARFNYPCRKKVLRVNYDHLAVMCGSSRSKINFHQLVNNSASKSDSVDTCRNVEP